MKAESGACLGLEMCIWKKWVTCPVGRCNCFRPATNQNPAYFFLFPLSLENNSKDTFLVRVSA
jgi:hypothetical protein